ncbi:carbohydrate esterase family 16 protein [Polyporus arcularius HHB13444]|uniref:Carbohydrate esterase family 16 protein n=1 Tax=Polyporus arcularius HHB13444 TaxID=1314778 RepID=A0A5C3NVB6_9APHY|nr:carbohydrate esterase family 16 protein [Polyporus arcularius HHB13444]
MSSPICVSVFWPGLDNIKHLVVFGDSFSAVGYNSKDRHPCVDHPLGIEFPGLTSCERIDETTGEVTYEPNWVGHFVQTVNAKRVGHPMLVHDYAVSGDTVARMKLWQVEKEFLPHLAPHPEWAPWTPSDTLFITWIGINDCTYNIRLQPSAAQRSFEDLFAAQEELYTAGARNFCFVDVPPAHTFPKGPKTLRAKDAYVAWNPMLRQRALQFSEAHADATVLIFSSCDLFTRVLSDPSYAEGTERQTLLFVDGFHPSSILHQMLSTELLAYLSNVVLT